MNLYFHSNFVAKMKDIKKKRKQFNLITVSSYFSLFIDISAILIH